MASLFDQVRDYVYRNYIVPARKIKTASVTVTAGDVHQALEFKNRMSLVCDALDAVKFQMQCGIYLIQRDGPKHGATARITFSVQHSADQHNPGLLLGGEHGARTTT